MKNPFITAKARSLSIKILSYFTLALGIIFLFIVMLPIPQYTNGFKSLSNLELYAKSINEFEKIEGTNYLNPNYENYYKRISTITFWNKLEKKISGLLSFVHWKKEPIFSCSFFKNILQHVTLERQQRNWTGNFIQKIDVSNTSKLVIFGATQGTFHTMVRYLAKLKDLNIIDENLKITNPNYYVIFMGNVVNRSPHTLENLSLILRLLQRNPNNIIYLKGTNEHPESWKNNTLGRELEIRAAHLSPKATLPLEQEVTSFFNTLPITLYCSIPSSDAEDKNSFFKISPVVEDSKLQRLLQESNYEKFLLSTNQKTIETFPLDSILNHNEAEQPTNINLRAIITDIKKRENYAQMDGLRLLPPIKGVISWTILSTSAEVYRRGVKFFHEAFVVITPEQTLKKWKMTLYNRDVRNRDPNFKTTTYNIFYGNPIIN